MTVYLIFCIIIIFIIGLLFLVDQQKRNSLNIVYFSNKTTIVDVRFNYYIHRVELQPYFTISDNICKLDNLYQQLPGLFQNSSSYLKEHPSEGNEYYNKYIRDMNSCLSIQDTLKRFEYITYFSDWNYSDNNHSIPTICRVVTECDTQKNHNQFITLPLEQDSVLHSSHIKTGYVDHDIPFDEKNNELVWRGTNSGKLTDFCRTSRYDVVQRYQNHPECDIKFTNLNISKLNDDIPNSEFQQMDWLDKSELLKHRCIISIEGNDRASNLYWALSSNSAVITCSIHTRSWYMEEFLAPWIHYIPVKDDWSDLIEKWKWSCDHPEETRKIAQNGKLFMKQFSDNELEKEIIKRILFWYGNNVKIKIKKNKTPQLKLYDNMIT